VYLRVCAIPFNDSLKFITAIIYKFIINKKKRNIPDSSTTDFIVITKLLKKRKHDDLNE
jgi:hypothetical protein